MNGEGRNIGFIDQDVEAIAVGNALDPQQQIGIRDRDPPTILTQFHGNGIVQHATGFIHDRHVVTLAGQHAAQIARRQHLHQTPRIGATQFDLALDGHIPHLHMVFEVAVICFHAFEHCRKQHAIIDGVGLYACRFDTV